MDGLEPPIATISDRLSGNQPTAESDDGAASATPANDSVKMISKMRSFVIAPVQ